MLHCIEEPGSIGSISNSECFWLGNRASDTDPEKDHNYRTLWEADMEQQLRNGRKVMFRFTR